MAKDYYKILGVDRNASKDEIKKQFRKKSIEYHPDRQKDKSDKEKKEAEEKFKLIAEAWSVLGDDEKRKKYDQFGDNWEQMSGMQGGMGPDIEEILRRMHRGFFDDSDFWPGYSNRKSQGPTPGQTIRVTYPLTIEEIYTGVKKEIEVPVKVRCKECNGSGGDVEECSYCHGTGAFIQTQNTPFGIIQQQSVCPYCHGTGKKMLKKCSKCGGTGFEDLKRRITLNISPFEKDGNTKKYTGMGYESKDPKGLNGDLLVQIIYKYDESKYAIQGNTIYEQISIPYYDAIIGCKKKVILPSKKEKEIEIKPLSQHGDQIILNREGISGGNYIYIISIELPKRSISNPLDKKEKELLEKIQKLHK